MLGGNPAEVEAEPSLPLRAFPEPLEQRVDTFGRYARPFVLNRNLDLAMRAAKAAYDATKGKDASVLDTYARAFHAKGDLDEAIRLQKKAVNLNKDKALTQHLDDALQNYLDEAK